MRKYLLLLVVVSFFLNGCPPHPKYKFNEISYKAFTRGSSESIAIEKDPNNYGKALLIHTKNGKEVVNKPFNKFTSLYKATKNINLEAIDQIEAPSKKHQFDGAMAAYITYTVSEKVYRSNTFDENNPPEELKPLVNYLKKLVQ